MENTSEFVTTGCSMGTGRQWPSIFSLPKGTDGDSKLIMDGLLFKCQLSYPFPVEG